MLQKRRKSWCLGVALAMLLMVNMTSAVQALSLRDPKYDMVWQDYGGGWSYMYIASVDYGYWRDASYVRLAYGYRAGQWCDTGLGGTWHVLGNGLSSDFIGDGAYHDLRNGWSYMYNASIDYAYWKDGSYVRFAYGYLGGQWCDTGLGGTWQRLNSGLNPDFLGDGAYHDLRNGWSYMYNASIDYAYWKDGSYVRFAYGYLGGQWCDTGLGGTWQSLNSGLNPDFLGDGAYHDLKNGWSYMYLSSIDYAYWKYGSNARLAYGYIGGLWWNHGNVGDWLALGSAGRSPSFIGDGNWHQMDSIWSYQFVAGYDKGYLQGYVSTPNRADWSYSTKQYSCDYKTQVLGLYDISSYSSVIWYDYGGGSSFSAKWHDWNYNVSDKSLTSEAIVFYTGSTTRDVSSWLSWLPVAPKPGYITRTETWDYSNRDWGNRYNHEVRAFGNNVWLVQREQGDYGNCGIIASIDAYSSKTSKYVGYTKRWNDEAQSKGWYDPNMGMSGVDVGKLITYMGEQLGSPVTAYYGDKNDRSLENLLSLVKNSLQRVILLVDLAYIPAFGYYQSPAGHGITLVGDTYINGQRYAQITNGWNIQTDTPTLAGSDPRHAYPITNILWSDLENAYWAYDRIE